MNVKLIDFDISEIDYSGYSYKSRTKKDTLRVKEELKKLSKGHCMYCYDEVIQETAGHQDHYIDQSVEQQFINYPLNIVYSCCDCNSAKNKDILRDRYKEVYGLVKPNKEKCDLECGSKKCYEITSSIYRYSTGIFNPITNKISKIIELSLSIKKFTVILPKESDKVRDYILKDRERHIKIFKLNSNVRIKKIIDVVCDMIIEDKKIPSYKQDRFKNLLALNVINYFLELERNEGFEKVLKEAEKIMMSRYFH